MNPIFNKSIITLLPFVILIFTIVGCGKNDDMLNYSLKNLDREITVVDENMFSDFSKETEGNFVIGSSSSAVDNYFLSGSNHANIHGIIFQSLSVKTGFDNGVFYAGSVSPSAAEIGGVVSYKLVDDPGIVSLFGTTTDLKLQTMTSVIFNTSLAFPAPINIASPLSDPLDSTQNNRITNTSVLTWTPDNRNEKGVLLEIMDPGLQGPVVRLLTPDDGSLSFSDLWPYLPGGASSFQISINRGNWKSIKGNDGRMYRIVVLSSSFALYSKSS